jgi:hypothetical protein
LVFAAKHAALGSTGKDWLAHDNVSEEHVHSRIVVSV